jgi:hypothetical protein
VLGVGGQLVAPAERPLPLSTIPARERQDWGGSLYVSALSCEAVARGALLGTPEGAEGGKGVRVVDMEKPGSTEEGARITTLSEAAGHRYSALIPPQLIGSVEMGPQPTGKAPTKSQFVTPGGDLTDVATITFDAYLSTHNHTISYFAVASRKLWMGRAVGELRRKRGCEWPHRNP